LKRLVCVPAEGVASLEEYLRGFDIALKVLQKPYAITRVMYEVCEDAFNDGVRYLEVRFSPILHTIEGASLSQVMEAICEGLGEP
jgi:adenosine deaminase